MYFTLEFCRVVSRERDQCGYDVTTPHHYPHAQEVKSGVEQLVCVRPSVLSVDDCQFMIEEQLISIECDILNTNRNINWKTNLMFNGTLVLNSSSRHMCKKE